MTELLLIITLLVFNGVFAMAEIALVSAKKARLQQREKEGSAGARLALRLQANPEQFLSTVQVGISLVGVLAGAFGGASLAGYVRPVLAAVPVLAEHAEEIAFGLVVAFITYLSLIIGELVPKNLALRSPEAIACAMARPMHWLSRVAAPIVWLLGISTRVMMRLFGKGSAISGPTPDEVQVLMREGLITGAVRPEEGDMVEGVFDLREVRAEEIMRPKPAVLFLHAEEKPEAFWARVAASRQTVFPVYQNSRDEIVGLVSLRDLYVLAAGGKAASLTDISHEPVFVSENQPALSLLETLRNSDLGAALVADEFGTIRGLITLEDLIEEIVGELRGSAPDAGRPSLRASGENAWLVDGLMEIDDVIEKIPDLQIAVDAEREPFQTLAGYIVHVLDRLPDEGDVFTAGGFQFEIVDMDRQRIDKVSIQRVPHRVDVESASDA
jgi:putative hemolysin